MKGPSAALVLAVLVGCAGAAPKPPRPELSPPPCGGEQPKPVPEPVVEPGIRVDGPDWFPFQGIDLAARRGTALDASALLDAPAGKHGPLRRRGERFVFADGKKVVFWGTSLRGPVNFPTPEQADFMAELSAQLGFNLTRHTLGELDTERLARFDDLASKLIERGIYLELAFELDGELEEARVAELERRIQELLSHVNPHTKRRYAAEPAVAMIFVAHTGPLAAGDLRAAVDGELAFQRRLSRTIRATGYAGLVSGESSQLDQPVHGYVSSGADWVDGQVRSLPATDPSVRMENGLVTQAARRRVGGLPYRFGEFGSERPAFHNDALVMVAAYGGLHGWSSTVDSLGASGFSASDLAGCRLGELSEVRCQPAWLGLLPALAQLVHRGDVKEAPQARYRTVAQSELFETPAWSEIPAALAYVTKTGLAFGSSPQPFAADELLGKYVTGTAATSVTGELFTDWGRGVFELDTPRSQGVVGRTEGRPVRLSNLTVTLDNEWASVLATSLEPRPISRSARILISSVGNAANLGTVLEPSGVALKEAGTAPVMLEPITGRVELTGLIGDTANASVYPLDASGRRLDALPAKIGPGSVSFELVPAHKTLHYEVVR